MKKQPLVLALLVALLLAGDGCQEEILPPKGTPESCAKPRPGPRMVSIKTHGSESYCVDTTEVTQGHFAQFLSVAKSFAPSWPKECDGTPLEPPEHSAEGKPLGLYCGEYYTPEKTPDLPMRCVDWCQAHAYCQWTGKRLCGYLEDKNGKNYDEWGYACSNKETTKYPYGDEAKPGECADETWAKTKNDPIRELPPAKDLSTCHGIGDPFELIFDMSGSVLEWINACPEGNACLVRGGCMGYPATENSCGFSGKVRRREQNPTIGFRCCGD